MQRSDEIQGLLSDLDDDEGLAMQTGALLTKQHRRSHRAANRDGGDSEDRRGHDETHRGRTTVEHLLDRQPPSALLHASQRYHRAR